MHLAIAICSVIVFILLFLVWLLKRQEKLGKYKDANENWQLRAKCFKKSREKWVKSQSLPIDDIANGVRTSKTD